MAALRLSHAGATLNTHFSCDRRHLSSFAAPVSPVASPSLSSSSSSFVPKGLGLTSPLLRFTKSSSVEAKPLRGLTRAALNNQQLKGAKKELAELIRSKFCNPILVRLGWHDSGTYRKNETGPWPAAGGAVGSIRFKPEIDHAANAGLASALALLEPIKAKYPDISWADLFQLASVTAIEVAGGPKIPLRYGRVDATSPDQCSPEGYLPDAGPPNPAQHLRDVFYRMGLSDQDIAALSGAHTLGRARPERSGWGKVETKYTANGPGVPGGQSWTVDWLKFDNSYFKDVKAQTDADLLVLPTDAVLFQDPEFKKYAEKYAEDEGAFFEDYIVAHRKLSELGSKFDPPQGVVLVEIDEPERSQMSDAMKDRLKAEYLSFGGSPDVPLSNNPFLFIMAGVAIFAILAKLSGAI